MKIKIQFFIDYIEKSQYDILYPLEKCEIIDLLKKFKNGKSYSVWVCNKHPDEVISQTMVTYDDIAEIGVPICELCGSDMEFVKEEWIYNLMQ